uniref:Uncharacterized protein n=1 Tax=Rhipicephalus microplus TaxID=6941 RepID=A0A6G5AIK1_RHIMP
MSCFFCLVKFEGVEDFVLLKSILESEQFQDAMKFATQPKARPRIILLRFEFPISVWGSSVLEASFTFLFYMSCTHYKVFHSGIFLGDASQVFFLLEQDFSSQSFLCWPAFVFTNSVMLIHVFCANCFDDFLASLFLTLR